MDGQEGPASDNPGAIDLSNAQEGPARETQGPLTQTPRKVQQGKIISTPLLYFSFSGLSSSHLILGPFFSSFLLPPTSLDAIWAGDKLVNLSWARNLQGGLRKCQPNMNL